MTHRRLRRFHLRREPIFTTAQPSLIFSFLFVPPFSRRELSSSPTFCFPVTIWEGREILVRSKSKDYQNRKFMLLHPHAPFSFFACCSRRLPLQSLWTVAGFFETEADLFCFFFFLSVTLQNSSTHPLQRHRFLAASQVCLVLAFFTRLAPFALYRSVM